MWVNFVLYFVCFCLIIKLMSWLQNHWFHYVNFSSFTKGIKKLLAANLCESESIE